jgi:hypothetical protein
MYCVHVIAHHEALTFSPNPLLPPPIPSIFGHIIRLLHGGDTLPNR